MGCVTYELLEPNKSHMSTGYIDRSHEVRPLDFDNVKYAKGHNQYVFTPYQLDQGREFMHVHM